ncbi:hypothetical protein N3K63_01890 [Microbacterium sp. W1N]|uniref:hypothetical protein n=1 Tax=Microbacterium festucae TaxID=2977531 RepID=UPI0021C0BDE9|nr:hypothetical protein [Microbacterium festucae]MCT9819032.1 hypothetical protein [Microbacterium festucae]
MAELSRAGEPAHRASDAGGILRGAAALSIGTAAVRAASAASQFVLVIWLAPSEFGVWAAVLASLTFLTSITNFGEVNGYLAGASTLKRVIRATRRQNFLLTLAALVLAGVIGVLSGLESGILAVILALSIPFQGESEVLYAAGVKARAYSSLVVSQALAATLKLGIGIALAAVTGSALALAIPTLAYYLILIPSLRRVRRAALAIDGGDIARASGRERFSWAINSLAVSLPLQIGFFVAQFVTDDSTLGIYYLSFQVSLGLSGLLAVPLARISLATFGETRGRARLRLATDLCHVIAAGVSIVVAVVAFASIAFQDFLPMEWRPAVPIALIMLASLPTRLMAPIIEGFQQSNRQWWQSTAFNLVETVASAVIAASLAIVGLEAFAVILTAWRLCFGLVRLCIVLRDSGWPSLLTLSVCVTLATGLLTVGVLLPGGVSAWIFGAALLFASVWIIFAVRVSRRPHRPSEPIFGSTHE